MTLLTSVLQLQINQPMPNCSRNYEKHLIYAAWPFPSKLRESRFSRILENYFAISPLDLDLEAFKFHFHFLKRVKPKIISLFISQKKNFIENFTFFLEKKHEIVHVIRHDICQNQHISQNLEICPNKRL